MTTTRKKQRTQIFRSLRRARIKLKRRAKTAFRVLELSQRDLHRSPIVPKLCRRCLRDAIGEQLRGRREFPLVKKRLRLLKNVVDQLGCCHRSLRYAASRIMVEAESPGTMCWESSREASIALGFTKGGAAPPGIPLACFRSVRRLLFFARDRPGRRAVGFDIVGVPRQVTLVQVLYMGWRLELVILVRIDHQQRFPAQLLQ